MRHNGEVDFVAVAAQKTLYVQAAYSMEDSSTAEREYGAFKGIRGEGEMLLETMDDDCFPVRDGVRHITTWEFEEYI